MKYLVNIREILEKEIEIEADSMMQAEEVAERQYREEKIVLNEMDYKGKKLCNKYGLNYDAKENPFIR